MLYDFLWWALKLFVGVPFRVRYIHAERVPRSGGVMLTPNHESYIDPIMVGMGVPRQVHFMARDDLWKHKVLGWLIGTLNGFPVKRNTADRAAIAKASELLTSGHQVLVFPQGTRHHAPGVEGMREGAGGAALIALRAGTPVVPVGIDGTDRIVPKGSRFLHFPRVTVVFGEPIDPTTLPATGRRERVDALTARIMEGMAAAWEEANARGRSR